MAVSIYTRFQKGREALEKGDLRTAESQLKPITDELLASGSMNDLYSLSALKELAALYNRQEHTEKAEQLLKLALKKLQLDSIERSKLQNLLYNVEAKRKKLSSPIEAVTLWAHEPTVLEEKLKGLRFDTSPEKSVVAAKLAPLSAPTEVLDEFKPTHRVIRVDEVRSLNQTSLPQAAGKNAEVVVLFDQRGQFLVGEYELVLAGERYLCVPHSAEGVVWKVPISKVGPGAVSGATVKAWLSSLEVGAVLEVSSESKRKAWVAQSLGEAVFGRGSPRRSGSQQSTPKLSQTTGMPSVASARSPETPPSGIPGTSDSRTRWVKEFNFKDSFRQANRGPARCRAGRPYCRNRHIEGHYPGLGGPVDQGRSQGAV